ncbi:FadR/GntR family transcriptional regulator [Dermacoccus nishinomiyaensis]|uniref:FadR/GntR family transcriptional regulator n=1 Tax=Dermacoccus nishinomiyaensis TaxID=1274 RepID=UPI000DAFBC81|nr:FadR/GntR family transcriptional regulator [Dermacoccus nishinomiyaensis]PZP03127.1 MAG: GntR family transcriptional regulator [Dermacoccus nishinomiyaensis]
MTHPCAPASPEPGPPPAAEESGLSNPGQPASEPAPAPDATPVQVETPAGAQGANPVASRSGRAYEGVVQWVEDGIVSGRLRVGDVLPAERDLAAQLAVSRAVVREGVRALHAIGVVDSRVGAGAAGGTVITAVPTEALNRFLRMHVALAQFSLLDVVDVRCSLEGLSARLAARNATDADHARLADLITAMRDDDLPPDVFNACDTDFHVAIARAAGNALATDLTVAIRESMRSPIRHGMNHVDDWPAVRARLREEHEAIAAALADGDGSRAADLLDAHIRRASEQLLGDGAQAAGDTA